VRPRLLALDIDGTLVDYREHASSAVIDAVAAVRDAGTHVVLSTGRSVHGIGRILHLMGLTRGHCVASNGAVIFTYPPTQVVSAVTFDARPAVNAVLEAVPDALVAVEVIGRGYRANGHFPEGEITGELWIEPLERLVKEPVTRVIIRDPQSSAEDFIALAARLGLHGTSYFVGFTAWLDLAPAGVSKASALALVADRLGLSSADVLAIGDGRNDVEMLAWAGRGVAMGQAPPEVKAVADAVTGTLEQDGVVAELAKWFPLDRLASSADTG
jgi:5-amino-6-(5-phospho-D-ribitylamino)uracil phosphatase